MRGGKDISKSDVDSRVFATVSNQCPFKCIYCFVENRDYHKSKAIDRESFAEIKAFAGSSDVIQPACDTELLLNPNWRALLLELVRLRKNISFATKLDIKDEDADFLSDINQLLQLSGHILNVGVTIVKTTDYKEIEPYAPAPVLRVETLKKLYERGIATNVIIRPVMPTLTNKEVEYIIASTHNFCFGYLIGPLYLNNAVQNYLARHQIVAETVVKAPSWNNHYPIGAVYCYEILAYIAEICATYHKRVYYSNEQCVIDLCEIVTAQNRLAKLYGLISGGNND
jgi:DNA repair photolyase